MFRNPLRKSVVFVPLNFTIANGEMEFENSLTFAQQMDAQDELRSFRSEFILPKVNGKEAYYFTGNSLGLQPKAAKQAMLQELEDWGEYGVEGHFQAKNPWFAYHEMFKEPTAEVVGAKPSEVTVMNGLSTNLHLLLVSFYRPQNQRFKILCEEKAFPSDQYVLESQVNFHGYRYEDAVVEVKPREGEHLIRHEDVLKKIEELGAELALVMIGGVNYYTGQLFDMKSITAAAHQVGALAGFDLAHAAGNVKLKLHDWQVDFAAWCSYKYLNSGPGSVSGIFVHEQHENNPSLPRFAGWWGNDPAHRFKMEKGFYPALGADGWQLSNAPVFAMAVHKVALDLVMKAGMDRLFTKRDRLTAYMEFIIHEVSNSIEGKEHFELISPSEKSQRGSQLSILAHGLGKGLFDNLTKAGVVADWREPNVIRLAPVPMYNSFEDVFQFGKILKRLING
jgi:kynureninase